MVEEVLWCSVYRHESALYLHHCLGSRLMVSDSGFVLMFGVWGFGIRVWGLGFGVQGPGFGVESLGWFGVEDLELRDSGSGLG